MFFYFLDLFAGAEARGERAGGGRRGSALGPGRNTDVQNALPSRMPCAQTASEGTGGSRCIQSDAG